MINQIEQLKPVNFDAALNGYGNLIAQREKEKQYWLQLAHEQHPTFQKVAQEKLRNDFGIDMTAPETQGTMNVRDLISGKYDRAPEYAVSQRAQLGEGVGPFAATKTQKPEEIPYAQMRNDPAAMEAISAFNAKFGTNDGEKKFIAGDAAMQPYYDAALHAQTMKQQQEKQDKVGAAGLAQAQGAAGPMESINTADVLGGGQSLHDATNGMISEKQVKTMMPQPSRPEVSAQDIMEHIARTTGDTSMEGLAGKSVDAIRKIYGNSDKANSLISDILTFTGNSQDVGILGIDKRFGGGIPRPNPGPSMGMRTEKIGDATYNTLIPKGMTVSEASKVPSIVSDVARQMANSAGTGKSWEQLSKEDQAYYMNAAPQKILTFRFGVSPNQATDSFDVSGTGGHKVEKTSWGDDEVKIGGNVFKIPSKQTDKVAAMMDAVNKQYASPAERIRAKMKILLGVEGISKDSMAMAQEMLKENTAGEYKED